MTSLGLVIVSMKSSFGSFSFILEAAATQLKEKNGRVHKASSGK